ncbi:DUF4401 domain-containing protein [Chryseobacterium sp. Ch-15]|uniref:DUF4401 domain-containing protein n=1 Tax=Chryseobacterium muglaense TaxID=2893752 RepID=A0A9Q3UT24_9FLAO|nr:DUF4401 domain-containing protein [Chryseobacterium muglaense]MBD3903522.1 DUF4401 domain-containing protein [Chryseobacterium muglaense]MCC9034594.1 DUF4401 domain-containing protein [Chryseobacterium muglaense]MCM2552857.1 DUF4401 domain-containing protein [Chryseobacterium muglaense]
MKTKEDIKQLLDSLQSSSDKDLKFNEEEIYKAYEKSDNQQSLAIKILSIFGGIMASCLFIAFLFITGIYDSEWGLLVLGIPLIIFGAFITKVTDNILLDTLSISAYIIGFVLVGAGLLQMDTDENLVSIIFILIAVSALFIVRSYLISFISVLIICGGFLFLMISNNSFDLIHIYISLLALILTFIYLKEAKLITFNKAFSQLYDSVRIALIFCFLAGLYLLGKNYRLDYIGGYSFEYLGISSVVIILAILYVISHLFEMLNIKKSEQKYGIYALSVLILLPTVFAPAISGAILIILLSFLVNYKTSLVIGVVAFIYFVSQYYYDLHYTLLTKSIVLFCSGILFLGLYFLTHKKLSSDEKI